ncbi:VOC family protein [Granulicatella seriolae]|uniref:VOC family protein n=1 Tax=Granulicatella seriolae TaxID=2967226 RepID=A0ABT1WKT4_9LACT|nr:VOC family protein [Granulicatella seriolae]
MGHTGIHHVSVIGGDGKEAYEFYHKILGLKLVMKTVNQDENNMYHLFFGDETGREGTEFTLFEMKGTPKNQFGTNAIERTMFLVKSREALDYWMERLDSFEVEHYGIEKYGKDTMLRFEDFDGQRLGFVYPDHELSDLNPYKAPDIPEEFLIQGIAQVHLRVRYPEATAYLLENYFQFEKGGTYNLLHLPVTCFKAPNNKFAQEIHVIEDKTSPIQRLGVGGIHHVAFGVTEMSDLYKLVDTLNEHNMVNSGIKNREFMQSVYFREPNYNLFEVATPIVKEEGMLPEQDLEWEQQPLFLPDFLEYKRESIEECLERGEETI